MSMSAGSGCRDKNECCRGNYAECIHDCTRSSLTDGVCLNNDGSYTCESCQIGGEFRPVPSGYLYSHSGWDGITKYDYTPGIQWTIGSGGNKRVKIVVEHFHVSNEMMICS